MDRLRPGKMAGEQERQLKQETRFNISFHILYNNMVMSVKLSQENHGWPVRSQTDTLYLEGDVFFVLFFSLTESRILSTKD